MICRIRTRVPARFSLQFNVVLRYRIWHTRRPMTGDATQQKPFEAPPPGSAAPRPASAPAPVPTREIGGRDGPEPTRFGDWEKNGRCIDF